MKHKETTIDLLKAPIDGNANSGRFSTKTTRNNKQKESWKKNACLLIENC